MQLVEITHIVDNLAGLLKVRWVYAFVIPIILISGFIFYSAAVSRVMEEQRVAVRNREYLRIERHNLAVTYLG